MLLSYVSAADDTAVGATDEIQDCVPFRSLRHIFLDIFHGVGDVHAVAVQQTVYFLDLSHFFNGESAPAQADNVDTGVADRLTCCFDVGRYVLVDEGTALKHDMLSDVAELMDECTAADDGEVVDHHFAGNLGCAMWL